MPSSWGTDRSEEGKDSLRKANATQNDPDGYRIIEAGAAYANECMAEIQTTFCVEHSDFPILTASETCDPFVSVQKLGEVFGGTHSN